jgi:hypothetical protein
LKFPDQTAWRIRRRHRLFATSNTSLLAAIGEILLPSIGAVPNRLRAFDDSENAAGLDRQKPAIGGHRRAANRQ